ncbi:Site-specific integrase (plasmid) [Rhodovastum atsumiense]|uniref:Site-specific integrase n=1 Tax=Rhodovastum atsumiense TaxID=504468 RepID=A0A5M6ITZ3_9PROT|nr:site-specific integrase [Rhodovastum atsumiense]KAA5611786.1 site-specific integrase [Rhodovastum atsumiense]CAH2606109.1 Site-specific integrase [Rhodovastum atsumiense]
MGDIVPVTGGGGSHAGEVVGLDANAAAARDYAHASRAASTRRLYATDWARFQDWCAARGVPPLPAAPELVALFIAAEADTGIAPPTITRRLAAIAWAHQLAGQVAPQRAPGGEVIREVMSGIRRSRGAPPARKAAADDGVLRDMLRAIEGDGLREVRARAVLAIGFAAALRRAELVAIRAEDVLRDADGVRLTIRRSKTDQEGRGEIVAIPNGERLRPVALLDAWLAAATVTDGFLFRRLDAAERVTDSPMSDRAVGRLVQASAAAAGYNPRRFGGHSLRAGFITSAARGGASIFKIQEVSRHRSVQVLAGYVRDAQLYRDHAGSGFL